MTQDRTADNSLPYYWDAEQLARAESLFKKQAEKLIAGRAAQTETERHYQDIWSLALEGVHLLALQDDDVDKRRSAVGRARAILGDKPEKMDIDRHSMMVLMLRLRNSPDTAKNDDEAGAWQFWLRAGSEGHSTRSTPHASRGSLEPQLEGLLHMLGRLHRTEGEGAIIVPPLSRAGLAYFWLCNHVPLGGSRGVVAHMIALHSLAASQGGSFVTALATVFLQDVSNYRKYVTTPFSHGDITQRLLWFAAKVLEAQKRQRAQIELQSNFMARLKGVRVSLNVRQLKTLATLFDGGTDAYPRGIQAADHMRFTGATIATATRDLAGLVAADMLVSTGSFKWRRYHLNVPRDPVRSVTEDDIRGP